jgi:hypothetical protein
MYHLPLLRPFYVVDQDDATIGHEIATHGKQTITSTECLGRGTVAYHEFQVIQRGFWNLIPIEAAIVL